ncbi:MAG: hypothetical protein RIR00_55 [Pseudomonadota bacterium]|jgi:hypothetical protein
MKNDIAGWMAAMTKNLEEAQGYLNAHRPGSPSWSMSDMTVCMEASILRREEHFAQIGLEAFCCIPLSTYYHIGHRNEASTVRIEFEIQARPVQPPSEENHHE